jgi:hypothetical protein
MGFCNPGQSVFLQIRQKPGHKLRLVIPGQSFDMHIAHVLCCRGVESRPRSPLQRFFCGAEFTSAEIEVPAITTKAPSSCVKAAAGVLLSDVLFVCNVSGSSTAGAQLWPAESVFNILIRS